MTWLGGPLLALDTETTGTDPETARVVQITVGMSARPGDWHPWTRVVNPGVPIPDEAARVHGYTDHRVQTEGTTPSAALTKVWATAERDALAAKLAEVRALHQPAGRHNFCGTCAYAPWPCATIRALDATPETGGES